MSSCANLNDEEANSLAILIFFNAKYFVNQHCLAIDNLRQMLTLYFHLMLACVKKNCEDSTKSLTHELQAKVLG